MKLKRLIAMISLVSVLLLSSAAPIQCYSFSQAATTRDYWPTDEWLSTTPEDQGLDGITLHRMNETITDENIEIDSVIVVKNGYIVYEEYYSYWSQYMSHTIQSCTKSFMSALIGIAIDMGYIDNISQPILDFFPNYTIENWDSRKENITLFHCITMSTGLEFHEVDIPYSDPANDLFAMYDTPDMWEYVLNRPMQYDPGTHWSYNSGGIELLGGVIEHATGYSVTEFAEEFLFNPIGIDYFNWWKVPASGQYGCSGGLRLTPRDMARFGYLYLNQGNWNGTQVISKEWVNISTQMYFDTGSWYHYGFTWWGVPDQPFYEATGHYEQKIYVLPEHDIVVVFTGDIADEDWHPTDYFVMQYVIPSSSITNTLDSQLIVNTIVLVIIVLPIPIVLARHRFQK